MKSLTVNFAIIGVVVVSILTGMICYRAGKEAGMEVGQAMVFGDILTHINGLIPHVENIEKQGSLANARTSLLGTYYTWKDVVEERLGTISESRRSEAEARKAEFLRTVLKEQGALPSK
jgi:hypothetical protein